MDPSTLSPTAAGSLSKIEAGCYAFLPNPLPPEIQLNWELVSLIATASAALAELAGAARNLPNPHLLLAPFIGREAVLSSRIEGTQASLSDVFLFKDSDDKGHENSRADIQEVINYINAIEHGLKLLETLPLSIRFIRSLHEVLMNGVRGKDKAPGDLRRIQNWIGPTGCNKNNARYVPPPIPEMKAALNALEVYMNTPDGLPPLVRLALIHYQFEAIHPFLDGNGRIGRLLITLILCKEKLLPQPLLYLSAYFENHRKEYYDLLLSVSQEGNWIGWVSFFLNGIVEQSKDALLRSKMLVDLQSEYRSKLEETRASAIQIQLLDHLFKAPYVRVNQVAKALSITARSAQQNIDKLVEHGILTEKTGGKRNRVFAATEILRISESEK
jgi:Fic family protein